MRRACATASTRRNSRFTSPEAPGPAACVDRARSASGAVRAATAISPAAPRLPAGADRRRAATIDRRSRSPALVDARCRRIAAGADAGARVRRHVLRLEQEIRVLAAAGRERTLGSCWSTPPHGRCRRTTTRVSRTVSRVLRAAIESRRRRRRLRPALPGRLFHHAWQSVQQRKARALPQGCRPADRQQLSDILRADFDHSPAGLKRGQAQGVGRRRSPGRVRLRRACRACSPRRLPPRRRCPRRARSASVACSACSSRSAFFLSSTGTQRARPATPPTAIVFDSCAAALAPIASACRA